MINMMYFNNAYTMSIKSVFLKKEALIKFYRVEDDAKNALTRF